MKDYRNEEGLVPNPLDSAAEMEARDRSTCSVCLARTYRGEECVCEDDGDFMDYDEALAEELARIA